MFSEKITGLMFRSYFFLRDQIDNFNILALTFDFETIKSNTLY